jgi:hypothetical protein
MRANPDSNLAGSEELMADLRRQLAECRAQHDEALAQQTATSEVLQVIRCQPEQEVGEPDRRRWQNWDAKAARYR